MYIFFCQYISGKIRKQKLLEMIHDTVGTQGAIILQTLSSTFLYSSSHMSHLPITVCLCKKICKDFCLDNMGDQRLPMPSESYWGNPIYFVHNLCSMELKILPIVQNLAKNQLKNRSNLLFLFKVGACIVNPDKRIVGIGYNGMPRGCADHGLPWGKTSKNE